MAGREGEQPQKREPVGRRVRRVFHLSREERLASGQTNIPRESDSRRFPHIMPELLAFQRRRDDIARAVQPTDAPEGRLAGFRAAGKILDTAAVLSETPPADAKELFTPTVESRPRFDRQDPMPKNTPVPGDQIVWRADQGPIEPQASLQERVARDYFGVDEQIAGVQDVFDRYGIDADQTPQGPRHARAEQPPLEIEE